ncbi:hypothetical protein [Kocuria sp. CNJ-770]|jgi:hypothetical protein|nr:hypothetical protein [Kocuria sp. CNJ-770]
MTPLLALVPLVLVVILVHARGAHGIRRNMSRRDVEILRAAPSWG